MRTARKIRIYICERDICMTCSPDKSIHLLANAPFCLHVSVSVDRNPKLTIVTYKSQLCDSTYHSYYIFAKNCFSSYK